MRTTPILILASLHLPACSWPGNPPKPAQYRADREPLLKRFPFLGDFAACRWESGVAADNSGGLLPAPSSHYIRGFVRLKPEDEKALAAKYEWRESAEPGFPAAPPADSGFPPTSGKVLESPDLMSKLSSMSTYCIGRILLDPEADMLYFYLQEL